MNFSNTDARIKMPNLLLIAGNGRNVGKTYLSCKIIRQLSESRSVTAVKISPHFHSYKPEDLLFKSDDFIILNETQTNSKDSSLMIQAGAKQVFFIMVKQDHLHNAFNYLRDKISDEIVVCESGGLIEVVEPALFLFIKRKEQTIVKEHLLRYAPIIVNNDGENFDLDIRKIQIDNNSIFFV